jgi:hypothetical protein
MSEDDEALIESVFLLKDEWVKERDPSVFEKATSDLRHLLSKKYVPHRQELVRFMALLLYDNDEFEMAVPYFRELAIVEPHSEYASSNLSLVLGQAGRLTECIDEMEAFLSGHPLGPEYTMIIQDEEDHFAQWNRENMLKECPHIVKALAKLAPHLLETLDSGGPLSCPPHSDRQ